MPPKMLRGVQRKREEKEEEEESIGFEGYCVHP